eukprot:RCo045343
MQHRYFSAVFSPEILEVSVDPYRSLAELEADSTAVTAGNREAVLSLTDRAVAKWFGSVTNFSRIQLAQDELDLLEPQMYRVLEVLGEGTYGVVFHAFDLRRKVDVAVKRVNEGALETGMLAHRIFRELVLMRHFQLHPCPNLIALERVLVPPTLEKFTASGGPLYMVTALMERDLADILRRWDPRQDEQKLRLYLTQILRGLHHMEKAGVLHRDLKPANLLVDISTGALRICDFGLSRAQGSDLSVYVATRLYRAPELIMGESQYNAKIDMWSVGCILGQMLRGGPVLFSGTDELQQLAAIIDVLGYPSTEDLEGMSSGIIRNFLLQSRTDEPGAGLRNMLQETAPAGWAV